MSVRSERERSKMQEKYQMILAQMLREDDNRFCVDCDVKSPRWASWNLGIFICIRCAGFHRNLGVHISRVKSVNLDSWTPEQIASMQAMGNNRARAVYEANLPSGFRRPQADAALEAFIRAKYEQKKWIAKDWVPPEIIVSNDLLESETNPRRNETNSDIGQGEKTNNNIPKIKPLPVPASTVNSVRQQVNERSVQAAAAATPTPVPAPVPTSTPVEQHHDLLGLDEPVLPVASSSMNKTVASTGATSSSIIDPLHELFSAPVVNIEKVSTGATNFNQDLESAFGTSSSTTTTTTTANNNSGIMSNDKIMALFNQPQSSPRVHLGTPTQPQPSTMIPPHVQQHHFAHHKSASIGSNLYQQTNNFPPRPLLPMQQPSSFSTQPGLFPVMHHNAHMASTPSLQTPTPTSAFTQDQLTNQFSQFVPFANSKTNTSASALISGLPTRPVTDYMPASSDLWQ